MAMPGLAILGEVVDVLAEHRGLLVSPHVDMDVNGDGLITISLTLHPSTDTEALDALGVRDDIRYVADVAAVRGFVHRYGFDAVQFDALLQRASAHQFMPLDDTRFSEACRQCGRNREDAVHDRQVAIDARP